VKDHMEAVARGHAPYIEGATSNILLVTVTGGRRTIFITITSPLFILRILFRARYRDFVALHCSEGGAAEETAA
jgi:hypothetical protein